MDKYKEIERSIIKKYRKTIWSRFIKAVKEYQLVSENDKIMVCISGGKDSFLMAKCMEELSKHGKFHFEVKYVVMNPGYNDYNLKCIKDNAKLLNIPIEIFESDIFDVTDRVGGDAPCYLCARMRRGYLYNKASELGCNKIALGHHFDDIIETTLLSMFYGSEVKTMMPKLHSDNFIGLELIRPMYMIKEEDIISWCNSNDLHFINCACKFVYESNISNISKRKEIKELIRYMKRTNSNVDNNIFKSMDNINLNCVLGVKKDHEYISFLDNYDKNKKEL